MSDLTRVRNRDTGAIVTERVFGGNALNALYENRTARLITDHVLSRKWPSMVYGWFQRTHASSRQIPNFIRTLGIDVSEAELPVEAYRSMNDFFTRRLKPDVRPIDRNPAHLVSPADGRVLVYPRLEREELLVKESRVSLNELLQDDAMTLRYARGSAIVVRLAPADYHRFHFPDDGVAGPSLTIPGRLHSVHSIALKAGAPSFKNKRVLMELQCRFGSIALIEIGALFVGTIVQTYRPGLVQRGQEKGFFQFGGSTIVLLAREGRLQLDEDLVTASADGIETQVRMGTRIATLR